jgi:hypothetical protein
MTDFKQPPPKHKPFHCGAYWHLWRRGLAYSIYNLMGAITRGGETEFYATQAGVALYFGAHEQAVNKEFRRLRKGGWINFAPTKGHFLWVPHDSHAAPENCLSVPWTVGRPTNEDGECVDCAQRKLLPWELNPDPLVGKLHALSGSKLRLYERRIEGTRRLARLAAPLAQFPDIDKEIAFCFAREMAEAQVRKDKGDFWGQSPNTCFTRVSETFRKRIAQLAVEQVEKQA